MYLNRSICLILFNDSVYILNSILFVHSNLFGICFCQFDSSECIGFGDLMMRIKRNGFPYVD